MRVVDSKDLGAAIRSRRKELGYSQKEFASYCGCGARFISELENGKETVQLEKALHAVAMLGMNVAVEPRG